MLTTTHRSMPRQKGEHSAARSAPLPPLSSCVQVRCDAASLGIPCTNCTAFGIECRIPQPKRKKTQTARAKDAERYHDCTPPNHLHIDLPVQA